MIPVYWVSYHEDILARGYWDQTLLEDLLAGALWSWENFPTFEHHTAPLTTRGIVVVPGRHHTEDVERLNAELAPMPGVLLIVTGDEDGVFPVADVQHPNIVIWSMSGRPVEGAGVRWFGSGYSPQTRATFAAMDGPGDRPLDWTFTGQANHDRRRQAVGILANLEGGTATVTDGFTQGDPPDVYLSRLASAKVAPCPSGSCTPDTFRFYEALEAGCVPLTDGIAPKHLTQYWPLLFLAGFRPPLIFEWGEAAEKIRVEVEDWPLAAVECSAWWLGEKRRYALQLAVDLTAIGLDVTGHGRITVLIPVSPIPSHPDLTILDETVASIRERLPDAEIVIMCDGVRPQQEARTADYAEHLRRVAWACLHRWRNARMVVWRTHQHQARMTRQVLAETVTPLILFVEHDTPLIGDIPWGPLARMIEDGAASVVRLHHEAAVLEPHRHLMVDPAPTTADCTRTVQWSQRPHLASTWWYAQMLEERIPEYARTFIEDAVYGQVIDDWNVGGEQGWRRWGLWLYTPPGDTKRSGHTDGRASDPKYDDGIHRILRPQR